MAKKFGKFLLLTAAVGSAAAAAYYYMQKKDSVIDVPEDDDYDDFSEDLDTDAESSRNYVSLNADAKPEGEEPLGSENPTEEKVAEETFSFTPLSEQAKKAEEKVEETVEEFFDEDDLTENDAPVGTEK